LTEREAAKKYAYYPGLGAILGLASSVTDGKSSDILAVAGLALVAIYFWLLTRVWLRAERRE
jgi:hypothetical protein